MLKYKPERRWWNMFKKLKAITDKGGNPNVPQAHRTHGSWLNTQRRAYKAGKLSADKVQALENLGLKWNIHTSNWEAMFAGLKAIADKGGDPNVPISHPSHGPWLNTQRMAYKAGKLSAYRTQTLEKLGIKWNVHASNWEQMFAGLEAIAGKGGDPNVAQSHPTHGVWLRNQRRSYKAGKLSAARIKALEGLGVKWYMKRGRRA